MVFNAQGQQNNNKSINKQQQRMKIINEYDATTATKLQTHLPLFKYVINKKKLIAVKEQN